MFGFWQKKDKVEEKQENHIFTPGNYIILNRAYDDRGLPIIKRMEDKVGKVLEVIYYEDPILFVYYYIDGKTRTKAEIIVGDSIKYFQKVSDKYVTVQLGENFLKTKDQIIWKLKI